MAAGDYRICCALFNAYIAKVTKRNPNLMTDDRRMITEDEILTLIAWKLAKWVIDNTGSEGFRFKHNEGKTIEVHYVEEKDKKKN